MEFKMPTEIITLPSKGVLYPKESLLAKGEIEMKHMTAREEDILTNINYIKNNTVLEKLMQSLIVTPINLDELLIGDKNAILIAARILGYGQMYETGRFYQDKDGNLKPFVVDLSQLKDKELGVETTTNAFDFTLPKTKVPITFKLLTHGDEKEIDKEIKGMQKLMPNDNFEVSTRLKYIITSVKGDNSQETIRKFVDNYMPSQDARELRAYYDKISPDVDLKCIPNDPDYTGEGIEFGINLNFFWPDARV